MVEEGSVNIEDLPPLADIDEEVGEYFFESDPLALKDNPDYQQLIKAMVKLQAQRAKAVKDMERLQEAREEALQDPLGFVTSLQNGDSLNLPGPQEIIQIPHIDWEKYNVKSITQGMRPKTRKRVLQENLTAQQPVQESKDPVTDDGKIMVRGRLYDGSKPQTFNQSWTDEEQRKLEELLIKYPDESIASHRWVKISKELGTRTPLQVQSRVQKYFIALKRGGLPVPGKNPRSAVLRKAVRNYSHNASD
ncbi:ZZ-type zinc finger-containing protein 3-like isoform X3 [Homarus americanus]|nr:ZZ-type zinc finger-containing protein 3-like isoform X3 [Homarus americanus]XP_042228070.1 ZZ-type zinc finger-containing protein 3-like isoform X3 [Homarus americanus]